MVPITVTMQWKIDIMNPILCNKDLGGMNDILQPTRSLFVIFGFHCMCTVLVKRMINKLITDRNVL